MKTPQTTTIFLHSSPEERKRVFDILKQNEVPIETLSNKYDEETLKEFPYLGWNVAQIANYIQISHITFFSSPSYYQVASSPSEFLALFGLRYEETNLHTNMETSQKTKTPKVKVSQSSDNVARQLAYQQYESKHTVVTKVLNEQEQQDFADDTGRLSPEEQKVRRDIATQILQGLVSKYGDDCQCVEKAIKLTDQLLEKLKE